MPEKQDSSQWNKGTNKPQDTSEEDVEVNGVKISKKEYDRQLTQYHEQLSREIAGSEQVFATLTGGVALTYKVQKDGGFKIDMDRRVVYADASWFFMRGFTRENAKWAMFHEATAHMRDLLEDMRETATRLKNDGNKPYVRQETEYYKEVKRNIAFARTWGKKIEDRWKAAFPGDPEVEAMLAQKEPFKSRGITEHLSVSEHAAMGPIFTFHNVFDDIAGNSRIGKMNETYMPGSHGEAEVRMLYTQVLFPASVGEDGTPTVDYRKFPRHIQFQNYFLRKVHVPDEEILLSPDVQAMIDAPIKWAGRTTTLMELLQRHLLVQPGRSVPSKRERNSVLLKFFMPVFEKLFEQDLNEWEPKKPQEGQGKGKGKKGSGQVNPFDQQQKQQKDNSIDQRDDEDEEAIQRSIQQDFEQQEADRNKPELTDEEKAALAQKNADANWATRHGLSQSEMRRYDRIKQAIEPYIEELSKVWDEIISNARIRYEREIETRRLDGDDIDPDEVVEHFGELKGGLEERVRIHEASVMVEVRDPRPEIIRIRLIGDISGSMGGDGIARLRELMTLLSLSVQQFNIRLDLTREETGLDLKVEVDHWAFDDTVEHVKPLTSEVERKGGDEMAETIRSVVGMEARGGTVEVQALQTVTREINSDTDNWRDIESGRVKEIVFLTSDGGFSDPDTARKYVTELTKRGVMVFGLLIDQFNPATPPPPVRRGMGMPPELEDLEESKKPKDIKSSGDVGSFAMVFLNGRPIPLGQIVNNHADVAPAVVRYITEALKECNL